MKNKIDISTIFLWLSIFIFLILLAWRAFGSSPTLEQIAFPLTIAATWMAFQAGQDMKKIRDATLSTREISLATNHICKRIESKLDK